MALYRSKLGPVGGGSGSKTKEGGIAVDLDPLSAFALMGGGSGEGDKGHQQNDAPSSDTRGTHPSSKGETMRPRRGESDSVSSPLAPPGSVEKTQGFESWHLADLDDLLPASQVQLLYIFWLFGDLHYINICSNCMLFWYRALLCHVSYYASYNTTNTVSI